MRESLPQLYLARHGETAWTLSGQHTGRTDLPLTPRGEVAARQLGDRLRGYEFVKICTSPLQRASKSCELGGFQSEIDPDLVEWDYGKFEGKKTKEIIAENPGWQLFRDGAPGGESLKQIQDRADRVVHRVRTVNATVLLFSSGHFLRALTARWLGLDLSFGMKLTLSTASVSILGYDHNLQEPAIRLWNDTGHVKLS